MDAKAARAGLIHEAQPPLMNSKRPHHLGHCLQVAVDDAVVADLAITPSNARDTSIDSLWTSIPTNMLRFAMACLRCMWLCAAPSSASRNPRLTT